MRYKHPIPTRSDEKDTLSSGSDRRIAIIGMSGRYPGGSNSPAELWSVLKSGKDAVTECKGDRWDLGWHHPDASRAGRVYTRAGGFLDQIESFDADFFGLSPREVRQVDPQQRLLLELAWEAHEDAGIAPRSRAGSDTGVFVGLSSNEYGSLVGPEWPDAYSNTGSSFSIAANRISYLFDFHGPSVVVDTACSSSIVCVHQACMSLLNGECSTALAGGVNLLIHIRAWLGFAKASMLSRTGRCKSFDASGDGYVRSEGGGFVLLKPLAAAERDGDRILGVILASGVNSDGRTMGLSMPNADAQEALMRKVYEQCGVNADDVYYVEAHGTGTAVGDPIECAALGKVLGSARTDGTKCLIGSVKSNIGHLEAAAGMAGLTKALLVFQHREIPGNLHFNEPNPKIDFEGWNLEVVTKATPLPENPVVIGLNSFGFGGTNAHLVLEEYRPAAKPLATTPPSTMRAADEAESLLVLSGHSESGLRAVVEQYVAILRNPESPSWLEICAGVATCRTPLRYRLALSASHKAEAADRLEAYLSGQNAPRLATGSSSEQVTPIAFVYSGNGPQWWGMGRELLAENAIFRAEIEAVDAIFAPLAGWSIVAEMQRPEAESRIALTEIAQPMLFAEQLGLTQVLRASGIHAAAVLGHSVGEVAAAWASGALTREQATQVIFHRSREQAKAAGQGRMAAFGISPAEAHTAMAAIPGWLELAATNAPQAVTIAGDPVALEQMVKDVTAAGKFARMLPLNYPFHTAAMDPLRDDLLASLASLKPASTTTPFVSTVEGREIAGSSLDADYWFLNVRKCVEFEAAVEHLLNDKGITLCIEIGPHPVLKDYVLQTAKAAAIAAVALPSLRRPGSKGPEPESDNLWTAICACHAHGASKLEQLFTRPASFDALPIYPWQRVRHWRGGTILPDIALPTSRVHPLLGHTIASGDGLWENTIDIHQISYLQDHVVQSSVLFPAAAHIELGLTAARLALGNGTLDIHDFEVLRPLAIPTHADPLLQTAVDVKDGTIEIRTRQDAFAGDWITLVRGRLSRTQTSASAIQYNLAELSVRMPHTVTAEEHYAGSSRRGLDYGPMFQGIRTIRMTDPEAVQREALAEVDLPSLDTTALDGYQAHPALLDSCIQIIISMIAQNDSGNSSTIPVQLKRIRSFAPLPSRVFCHAIMRRESPRSAVVDIVVMDASGHCLLTIEEARCQKVDFRKPSPTPLLSEWWRPDPRVVTRALSAPLPDPHAILASMKSESQRILSETRRAEFYSSILPRMEQLTGAYAAEALASFDLGKDVFDTASLARKIEVRRTQMPLLNKLLRIAEEDSYLQAVQGGWQWKDKSTLPSTEMLWRSLFTEFPAYQAELLLLAQAGESLIARLQGEEELDRSTLLDQSRDNSPYQSAYNQLLRSTLDSLVAFWPADRPLRVLEIGGGSAGLTSWALAALPVERTDYLFTDPSDAAVAKAEHRLQAHRSVRCAVLEIDRDFAKQGQPEGYFDLVIGSHLAATGDAARALLSRIATVMAPDAQLLLLQPNAGRFAELTELATGATAHQWLDTALQHGFEDALLIDDSAACPTGHAPQQSILLTRRKASDSLLPVAHPVELSVEATRSYLLVTDAARDGLNLGRDTVAALKENGHAAVLHVVAAESATLKADLLALVQATKADHVVYLSGASKPGDLLITETERCLHTVALVEAMEATRELASATLTLVTRGALPTANGGPVLDPAQSPLWGLGRVIGNEYSGLDIRMVDLQLPLDATELAAELIRRDDETEVQLSAGQRYVNRERLTTLADEAHRVGAVPEGYTLDFQPSGGLDSLYLRELKRRAPEPDEVEIAVKASGLNFRDVLWAMGMLPEEAVEHGFSGPTIGMECAGEILRVGANVTAVKPGDRVVAFASSCFASHVTTHQGSVALIPEGIDYAAAATIPTAFLTAYYAFDTLARLQPGETVLIHGAAGGVGLAAIQIAKMKGAKVIGTAGSTRKRRMLEMLGVDHALSSRSLDFADEVMRLTEGVGVDVVLNSLAGEAITKSLECLRPFGRFLEIGKRDLYANSRIGLRPFRNNLSYYGIDADTLLIERPDLTRTLFKEIIAHFAHERLRPLPFQEVPISRAAEAFRAMQQSRHIGKLVISMGSDRATSLAVVPTSTAIRPGVTYLVTGGLGGFGLATAFWLAEQGATSLALLSRTGGNSPEALEAIAKLASMGVSARAFAADIADADALKNALTQIRAEMAPLRGVIHSAAVIEDALIMNVTEDLLERVFRPKLIGAWNLHEATLNDGLEIFVLYSSSSAVVGNPGQGAYVAANLYLDSLAFFRRSHGLPALSVGWGAIKDAGFLTRHESLAEMMKSRTGLDATPSHEALAELGRLLSAGSSRVAVARFDLLKLSHMVAGARVPRFAPIIPRNVSDAISSEETLADLLLNTPQAERRGLVQQRIKEHAARVLGTGAAQIDISQPLSELGLDSLMAVELAGGLERDLGKPIPVMQLLSSGSLAAIAELVLKILGTETEAEAASAVPEKVLA